VARAVWIWRLTPGAVAALVLWAAACIPPLPSGDACADAGVSRDAGSIADAGFVVCSNTGLSGQLMDPTFGNCGRVRLDVGGIGNVGYDPQGLGLLSDGRIVVAGVGGTATDTAFLVARFLDDGTLDPSFGDGGIVQLNLTDAGESAEAVIVEPDDTVVVAGSAGAPDVHLAAVHLDINGGVIWGGVYVLGTTNQVCNGVARTPDGGLRFGGQGWVNGASPADFHVIGLHADGVVDTAFGDAGISISRIGDWDDFGADLISDSQGRLLVAGTASVGSSFDSVLVRLLPDGTNDPAFNSSPVDFDGGDDSCGGIVIQSDTKVICAGASSGRVAIARFLDDGALDPAFGAAGRLILDWDGGGGIYNALQLPNGELLVAGSEGNQWALARLALDGQELERAVGMDLGTGDGIRRVASDAQGRWVLFGGVDGDGGNDIALVRLAVPWPGLGQDAGSVQDAGRSCPPGPVDVKVGCGCTAAPAAPFAALLLGLKARHRRRVRRG
jgi:uncharacterized delta-60 repeat protein/MYXO-CTERM domain-containing protein